MPKITSLEAKSLTEKSATVCLERFWGMIRAHALQGDTSVAFSLKENESKFFSFIKSSLEAEGYKVKRNKGYDQRDNESWDNIEISW